MAEATAMAEQLIDDDDKLLRHTQGIRLRVVEDVMVEGKVPVLQEDRELLVKMLDGIDRQAVAKKRIKSEDKTANAAQQAAAALEIMAKRLGKKNPFEAANGESSEPKVPTQFSKTGATIVPGELDIGDDTRTYDDFIKENDGKV